MDGPKVCFSWCGIFRMKSFCRDFFILLCQIVRISVKKALKLFAGGIGISFVFSPFRKEHVNYEYG